MGNLLSDLFYTLEFKSGDTLAPRFEKQTL
jgi:hypothetical protein